MSANRDRVEHAITETLNGQQLGRPNIQCQLEEMRRADPRHYLENIRLMEKMTSNYKDFPHLELHNAELEAERSERAGRVGHGRRHHEASPDLRIEAAPRTPVIREDLPPLQPSRQYLERIVDSPTVASTTPGAGRILAERNVWPPVPRDGY